jgi:hypothetical protein
MDDERTMNVTPDELAMLLGAKDIEIFALQKRVADLQKRVEELTPKPDVQQEAAR